MRYWQTKAKRPRLLEAAQVCRLLYRGGVLVAAGNVWAAYRTPDTRRMRVGVVPEALAVLLETTGRAERTGSVPERLVAGPALDDQALAATLASD